MYCTSIKCSLTTYSTSFVLHLYIRSRNPTSIRGDSHIVQPNYVYVQAELWLRFVLERSFTFNQNHNLGWTQQPQTGLRINLRLIKHGINLHYGNFETQQYSFKVTICQDIFSCVSLQVLFVRKADFETHSQLVAGIRQEATVAIQRLPYFYKYLQLFQCSKNPYFNGGRQADMSADKSA